MEKENAIKLFNNNKIRTQWDEEREEWFFSIVDVIGVLTESDRPRKYWSDLKSKLLKEDVKASDFCGQMKMIADDGKNRNTDVASKEQLFRLIQSAPSSKAEPFKLWLAKVGSERIDEIQDPEIGFDRLMETYLKKGYSKEWINQRLKSIEVRKGLTEEWEIRGVQKGQEFAVLTDEITKAWAGINTKDYKELKNLKQENLRDHMSNLELVLNMLAEVTRTEISKKKEPKTFKQSNCQTRWNYCREYA